MLLPLPSTTWNSNRLAPGRQPPRHPIERKAGRQGPQSQGMVAVARPSARPSGSKASDAHKQHDARCAVCVSTSRFRDWYHDNAPSSSKVWRMPWRRATSEYAVGMGDRPRWCSASVDEICATPSTELPSLRAAGFFPMAARHAASVRFARQGPAVRKRHLKRQHPSNGASVDT